MFVRKKTNKGCTYYYLVRSERGKDGKVRQVPLCYLGEWPSVDKALIGLPQDVATAQRKIGEVKEYIRQHPRRARAAGRDLAYFQRMLRVSRQRLARLQRLLKA